MKNSVVLKRLKAFVLDYFIILIYIGLLLGTTLSIFALFKLEFNNVTPVTGELISFTFLTLPVILYFTLSENTKHAGTFGKKKSRLQVVSKNSGKATLIQLFIRNCLKFLPWEIAHFFIYQLFYFDSAGNTIPNWVLAGLITAQGLALVYLLFIIFQKNNRSIYELLSGTKVIYV